MCTEFHKEAVLLCLVFLWNTFVSTLYIHKKHLKLQHIRNFSLEIYIFAKSYSYQGKIIIRSKDTKT
jgi:hypothetical protein